MFDFINEMPELKSTVKTYRYINYGGEYLVLQGYKDVLCFNEEEIIVKLKSGEMSVKGRSLSIHEITENTIVIKGRIFSVESGDKQ